MTDSKKRDSEATPEQAVWDKKCKKHNLISNSAYITWIVLFIGSIGWILYSQMAGFVAVNSSASIEEKRDLIAKSAAAIGTGILLIIVGGMTLDPLNRFTATSSWILGSRPPKEGVK